MRHPGVRSENGRYTHVLSPTSDRGWASVTHPSQLRGAQHESPISCALASLATVVDHSVRNKVVRPRRAVDACVTLPCRRSEPGEDHVDLYPSERIELDSRECVDLQTSVSVK